MELQDWLRADHLAATTCQFKDSRGDIVTVRRLRQDLFSIDAPAGKGMTASAYGVLRHYDRYAPVYPVFEWDDDRGEARTDE